MFWRFEDVAYNVSVEPVVVPRCSQQMAVCTLFHVHCFTAPSSKYNLENLVHYTDSTLSRLSGRSNYNTMVRTSLPLQ